MKTQLDLMNIASSYEKPSEYTQKKMDIKPVINEILALKLMPVNAGIAKGREEGLSIGQDTGSHSRNMQLVELIANRQHAWEIMAVVRRCPSKLMDDKFIKGF